MCEREDRVWKVRNDKRKKRVCRRKKEEEKGTE